MTPSARLQSIIELLNLIESEARPADAVVSHYFRARRYIGAKDRAEISAKTYDILRHHARLEWWLEKVKAEILPRSKLLAYLLLLENRGIEGLQSLFSGKKFAPSPLLDEEIRWLKKLKGHTIEHPQMPEAVIAECPKWAEASLRKLFGKSFLKEMTALLRPAPLDLRVNTLKASREEILQELKKQGFKASSCKYSPYGIRIENRPNIGNLSLLREGFIEIQDEGSQLVAILVDAKPGMRVVDFCAGAGGKTLALAAQMQNKGRIVACDVMTGRLKRSAERFLRAGVHNIETKLLESENDPWVKRHKESFDRVLVDAPCSGTGTWRRNPDQRWREWGMKLEELVALQSKILSSAARLVKPGGRLIYATCSFLPEENEAQVENFLNANEDFELLPAEKIVKDLPQSIFKKSYLSLSPASHGTDGFFAAVMCKSTKSLLSQNAI